MPAVNFHKLKPAFKGDIILPSDPDYSAAIARWAANAQKAAAAVLYVKDAQDVALALAFAREHKLDIAVRGELGPPVSVLCSSIASKRNVLIYRRWTQLFRRLVFRWRYRH